MQRTTMRSEVEGYSRQSLDRESLLSRVVRGRGIEVGQATYPSCPGPDWTAPARRGTSAGGWQASVAAAFLAALLLL